MVSYCILLCIIKEALSTFEVLQQIGNGIDNILSCSINEDSITIVYGNSNGLTFAKQVDKYNTSSGQYSNAVRNTSSVQTASVCRDLFYSNYHIYFLR